LTAKDLEEANAEVLVSVMGYDEVYSQTIHARFSYLHEEILWNRKFNDFVAVQDGILYVEIDKISDLKPESPSGI
jgi:inward rectifier potassium channel